MARDPFGRVALSSRRIAVLGAGLVGTRAAVHLATRGIDVVLVGRSALPRVPTPVAAAIETVHGFDHPIGRVDAAVLATESMHQVVVAGDLVERGIPTVATADRPEAVRALWMRAGVAARRGVPLAVGVAHAPGLTTAMITHLARGFDEVEVITTARFGTGGPVCAREHHRSMGIPAYEVRGGRGRWVQGGSGRMLVWFPEPAGPHDCYRAGLAEPFLLQQLYPTADRISALQAATRRDRLTSHLPMLRAPHAEGLVGAAWAEVRGRRRDGAVEHRVMAATAPQASGAAAIAAVVAERLAAGQASAGELGRANWATIGTELLRAMPDDVGLWIYDGVVADDDRPNAPLQAARKWRGGRETAGNVPTGAKSFK